MRSLFGSLFAALLHQVSWGSLLRACCIKRPGIKNTGSDTNARFSQFLGQNGQKWPVESDESS